MKATILIISAILLATGCAVSPPSEDTSSSARCILEDGVWYGCDGGPSGDGGGGGGSTSAACNAHSCTPVDGLDDCAYESGCNARAYCDIPLGGGAARCVNG